MPIPFPVSIRMMAAMAKAFSADHKGCKQTAAGRARFEFKTPEAWLKSWDTGASSRTIWNFMMTGSSAKVAIPLDPSDFGRCYRLLKAFPEWRARMPELGARFAAWSALVAFWPKLEQLFEQESPSGQCPKLFEALKELGG